MLKLEGKVAVVSGGAGGIGGCITRLFAQEGAAVVIADLLKEVRVDLWLCGHVHGGKRKPTYVKRRGPTTFINVSALGRMYGTGACTSYVLEMQAGQKEMLARCRNHETGKYLDDQEVRIEFPHPWRFAGKPTIVPAKAGVALAVG